MSAETGVTISRKATQQLANALQAIYGLGLRNDMDVDLARPIALAGFLLRRFSVGA
ncbi:MAG: hypothetical protein JNM18_07375 [Planctomycetaceae bacterium]|nr:hypothetical protein [Planctomycetaceae bacterium]